MPRLVTSASKFTAMKVSALRPDTVSNDTAEGEVMKARVTIEYDPDWPEGLSVQELREREEQAWMTMLQMSDLTFEVVKCELIRD